MRPHDLLLVADSDVSTAATIPAMVTDTRRVGGRFVLTLHVAGQPRPLELDLPDTAAQVMPTPGATVRVQPRRHCVFADG